MTHDHVLMQKSEWIEALTERLYLFCDLGSGIMNEETVVFK